MPRTARHTPGGVVYHVLNRAVARIPIFKRENDYRAFMRTFVEAHQRASVDVLAYCIMPTHWHLLLRPQHDGQLSDFMQWLTLTHVQRWRTCHHTVGYGPLYQGRFKAFAIQDDAHFLTVARYIERNPVRARLALRAEHWSWSSLAHRLRPADIQHPPLSDWPVPRRDDWLQWVNAPQTAAEEQAIGTCIHRSRPFGSPVWQQTMAERLSLASCFRPRGRPRPQALGE